MNKEIGEIKVLSTVEAANAEIATGKWHYVETVGRPDGSVFIVVGKVRTSTLHLA
jgi:hypothetical protein